MGSIVHGRHFFKHLCMTNSSLHLRPSQNIVSLCLSVFQTAVTLFVVRGIQQCNLVSWHRMAMYKLGMIVNDGTLALFLSFAAKFHRNRCHCQLHQTDQDGVWAMHDYACLCVLGVSQFALFLMYMLLIEFCRKLCLRVTFRFIKKLKSNSTCMILCILLHN